MSSVFGNRIKVSVFGQSHSEAIGVVIDSLPAGFEPDMEKLRRFTMRRTAIGKEGVTARKEPDEAEILSGLVNGKTCGAPLCAIIRNTDVRSSDYDSLKNKPRPSHADYTAFMKYGESADFHGGGHFSGRLTAPLVFAGGLIIQLLAQRGIRIGARVKSIGNAYDKYIDHAEVSEEILDEIAASDFPSYGDPRAMQKEISDAQTALDSVGGQVECFILGLGAGIGEPMFDVLESRISSAVFAIPAVKGIEFGEGFALTGIRASEANDEFYIADDGTVKTRTNSNGGILGGISTGMPIVFSTAFKPTPSIALKQRTVDLETMTDTDIEIRGRHDPCIAVRAAVCVESAAAIALADLIL